MSIHAFELSIDFSQSLANQSLANLRQRFSHAKVRSTNRMIERLWRSLKYECIYLNAFEAGSQARTGIGE